MARATYLAPGVYVEEVPSARQPIAPVGTNTVGFIGMVPDKIYYPIPNPDYDPVTASAVIALDRLQAEKARLGGSATGDPEKVKIDEQIEAAKSALKARIDSLDAEVKGLEQQEPLEQKAKDDTEKAFDEADKALKALTELPKEERDKSKSEISDKRATASATKEAQARAAEKLAQTQQRLAERKTERAELQAEYDAPPPPAPPPQPESTAGKPKEPAPAEKEDLEFADSVPDTKLLTKSVLRPYVLAEFDVDVLPLDTKLCTNFSEYTNRFGPFSAFKAEPELKGPIPDLWRYQPMHPGHHALTQAVNGFFQNGGSRAFVVRVERPDQLKDVLARFESIDELALIAAPGLPKNSGVWEQLMAYAETHENVFAILDCPGVVNDGNTSELDIEQLFYGTPDNVVPRPCKDAAYYFPYIEVVDPAKQLQDADPARQVGLKWRGRTYVGPSGYVAGIYARTDEERGVHKAPANSVVRGALNVKYYISKPKQELLNPQGVNCIRNMNGNISVWGARTIGGDRNGEWKYVSVRRLFLFLQESIDEGTQWVVFEPNDEALWGKIRLNVSAFLTNVWRSGALFGLTPNEAFYVKCDAELNPPEVRDLGQVITEIGVAIVRPAEFVIFRITQATGQTPS